MTVKKIRDILESGDLSIINNDTRIFLNNEAVRLLNTTSRLSDDDLDVLRDLVIIGNLVYNNSDMVVLPIEDGVYDLLVVKLEKEDYNKFTPGAKPLFYDSISKPSVDKPESKKICTMISGEDETYANEMLFPEIITRSKDWTLKDLSRRICGIEKMQDDSYISKRLRNTAHDYPELVGTLDKCKFVLNAQAKEVGAFNEDNVKVLERDFFIPLLQSGIINTRDNIYMIGTIKYDGVSVAATVTDHVISAQTRGDTDNDETTDITPILYGYRFPNAPSNIEPIGMKFEAIVMYHDLVKLNELKGTNYVSGRHAIIGIMGSSDAYRYRDFITLVPLQASFPNQEAPDRLDEIKFLNKYYATKECLKYVLFNAPYRDLLFLIKKYVEEAEFSRKILPFMYDGIVLEFWDKSIRTTLGRKNSINQYAMAVKFNALKKQTIFRGYTYTVGQDGSITPMIHYDPVEFIGTIHTKSTGSSYDRFNKLDLRIGDIIDVTYVNDVMPYVTKCDITENDINHSRDILDAEKFPTHCPSCGTKLIMTKSMKSVICPNIDCRDRSYQRMSNMLAKLGIKDFSDSAIQTLGKFHFYELMEMNINDFTCLGPTNAEKFYSQLVNLKVQKLNDYRIVGAIGFTNIGAKKWKIIFSEYPLAKLLVDWEASKTDPTIKDCIRSDIANIKGAGPITADTIIGEFDYFEKDIKYIVDHGMYIETIRSNIPVYKIRFTGFRDREIEEALNKFPHVDCDGDAGVTKDTSVLLVPTRGYSQGSKVKKALKYGVPIVYASDFIKDPTSYGLPV